MLLTNPRPIRLAHPTRILRDGDAVIRVGGRGAEFVPELELRRWDGSWVRLTLLHDESGIVSVDQQAVVWTTPSLEARWYRLPDKRFEFATVFYGKVPDVVRFAYETSADIETTHQPFLFNMRSDGSTWEPNGRGGERRRPIDVADSFAAQAAAFPAEGARMKIRARRTWVSRFYETSFPGTENPLSEGGLWIAGSTTGIWKDVRCTPGFAYGGGESASPPYDDPTSVLSGHWPVVQSVEATVRVDAIEGGVNQEVELRLLTSVEPGHIYGYEALFSITTNPYIELMRWDGDASDISYFHSIAFGAQGQQLLTGYRIKATVDKSGLFKAFVDSGSGYVEKISGTDTTYRTGAPGVGFFKHGGAAGPLTGAGLTYFSATASDPT